MKRREIPGGVRFITFSTQHRLPILTANSRVADALVDQFARARAELELQLFAWVVMPEHVHVIARTSGDRTLEHVLRSIKMSIAKRALARCSDANSPILDRLRDATGRPRFWQKGGGFDRNVRDSSEFAREVRYIHLNPVERGLAASPEAWRWSSVRWWMGQREGEMECDPPPGPPGTWDTWTGFR